MQHPITQLQDLVTELNAIDLKLSEDASYGRVDPHKAAQKALDIEYAKRILKAGIATNGFIPIENIHVLNKALSELGIGSYTTALELGVPVKKPVEQERQARWTEYDDINLLTAIIGFLGFALGVISGGLTGNFFIGLAVFIVILIGSLEYGARKDREISAAYQERLRRGK